MPNKKIARALSLGGRARATVGPSASAPASGIAGELLGSYDARMMLPRPWITEFIGAALRRELTIDPDWAFDVADELYITMSALDPMLAADSAFDAQHDLPTAPAVV